jgi:hypothetical protein
MLERRTVCERKVRYYNFRLLASCSETNTTLERRPPSAEHARRPLTTSAAHECDRRCTTTARKALHKNVTTLINRRLCQAI